MLPPFPVAMPAAIHAERPVDRLAAAMLPEDALVALAGRFIDADGARDPKLVALYEKKPGLRDFVRMRTDAAAARLVPPALPGLRRDCAAILAASLDGAEIDDTLAFFTSATGRRVLGSIYGAITPDSNDATAPQAVADAVMSNLQVADFAVVTRFVASAAMAKLSGVVPQVGEASRAWSAQQTARNRTEIDRVRAEAIAAFDKGARS